MKNFFIILFAACFIACNSNQNADGTSGVSDASGTSVGATDTGNSGNGTNSGSGTDAATVTTASIDTSVSNFIQLAVMNNAMEIEASEVAQKKSTNSDVQSFAGMMVSDHGNALKKLRTLAKKKRVEIPMMVDANGELTAPENSAAKTRPSSAEKYGSQSRPGQDVVKHDQKDATSTGPAGSGSQKAGKGQNAGPGNAMFVTHQEKLNRLKLRTGADFDREYMKMMLEDHAKAIQMLQKAINNSDADVKTFAQQMLPTVKIHETSAKTLMNKIQSRK
jgi:putative membrane protein